jgi:NAD-dependent DNA ligase
LLTDNEYDIIKEFVESKFSSCEAICNIGAPVIGDKKKVVLPYFMPSMNKIKPDTGVLEEWKKKFPTTHYVLSHKLDGVSCLLVVKPGGRDRFLYTRGDGRVGQDISHLIPYLSLPPKNLDFGASFHLGVVIRCELIVPKKTFQEKFAATFANPRNFVSGVVNQKVENLDISLVVGNIHLVSYELLFPERVEPSLQMRILQNFSVFGLIKVVSKVMHSSVLSNEYLSGELMNARESSIYEIDGLVCSADSVYERKDKNPEHAFAFKMVLTDQIAEAKVVDVLWSPSKDGYLKPRIRVEPLHLGGVCIEYATGFNAKFIQDHSIGIGSLVELIRSGDVIPHIRRVLSGGICGAKMPDCAYKWNETGVDLLLNKEELSSDLTVREKVLTGFFQGIGVVGLSSGLVTRLISCGYDTVGKIVAMKMEDWLSVEGFQKKLATKIHDGIRDRLDKVGLVELMSASNLFGRGFGERKLGLIMEECPDLLVYTGDKKARVLAVKGMAEKTAQIFLEGVEPFLAFLKEIGVPIGKFGDACKLKVVEEDGSSLLKGKTIVLTGFRDAALEEELKKRGAKIGSSVSKNTFLVLVKDKKGGDLMTGKVKDAKELGVSIISVDDFKTNYTF